MSEQQVEQGTVRLVCSWWLLTGALSCTWLFASQQMPLTQAPSPGRQGNFLASPCHGECTASPAPYSCIPAAVPAWGLSAKALSTAEIPKHPQCLAQQWKGQHSQQATHKPPPLSSAAKAASVLAGLWDPPPNLHNAVQETSLTRWELLISPRLGWIYPKVSGLVFQELDM